MHRKYTSHQSSDIYKVMDISIVVNRELTVREASLVALLSSIEQSVVTIFVLEQQAISQVFDCISQSGATPVYLESGMTPTVNGNIGLIHDCREPLGEYVVQDDSLKIRLRWGEVDTTLNVCLVKSRASFFNITVPFGTVELPLSDISPFIHQYMTLLVQLHDDAKEPDPQQAVMAFLLDTQRHAMSHIAHAPSTLSVYEQFESYLEQIERNHRDLFNIKECIAFPLFVVDSTLTITQANHACGSIIKDIGMLSVVGKNIEDLNWSLPLSNIDQLIVGVIESGLPQQTLLHNEALKRVYVLRVMPYHSQGEQVSGAILVFEEVSEKWYAENNLRASEQHFRQVIEALPQLIIELSASGECHFVNSQFLAYTGAQAITVGAISWLNFIVPEDRAVLRDYWDKHEHISKPRSVECRVLRYDGCARWFNALFVPVHDQSGTVSKWFGCFNDIEDLKRVQLSLERSQSRISHIINSMPEAILVVDHHGIVRIVNKRIEEIFGYEAHEIEGRAIEMLLPERYRNGHVAHRLGYVQKPETLMLGAGRDLYARHKDGSEFPVELGLAPLEEDGQVYTVASVANITQRKNADVELNLAAKVFSSTMDGIFILDVNRRIIKMNAAAQKIFGYQKEELLSKTLSELRSDYHSQYFYENIWRDAQTSGGWQGEVWHCDKAGNDIPMWLSLTTVFGAHGDIERYIATMYDISNQVKAQEHIYRLAHYDTLTQLPNRTLFIEKFEECIQAPIDQEVSMALLFVDLDNFKQVNDTLGHTVGDILLCQAAERMRDVIREQDIVSRHSGDEFAILLIDVADCSVISDISERLCHALSKPYDLGRGDFFISASLGIARYPSDGKDINTLLRHADLAMYRAKDLGRNQFHFYLAEMSTELVEVTELLSDLRIAIEQEQLLVQYQPIVDIQAERCVGVEALVRWNHPTKGLISPEKFIPVAEDNNLILPLGEWVLRTACRQIQRWNQKGIRLDFVTINVSGKQIMQSDFSALLIQVLDEYQLEAEQVLIELTESFVMHESETAINRLIDIRNLGIGIAIDDFGTGYSSLSYLKKLPVTKLKLDRSFVCDLPTNDNDVEISRAIFRLGDAVGLKVIAEGVETFEQHQFLVNEGYHLCQGYYYAKPMDADDIDAFWQQGVSSS
ncbi:EAL domain-containing protein [Vibrio zhugei]|uniref:EAL domain-containing protein n=2 Tax=Vibrio zhugei TaxID=2479546 RepID=A0ABV7CE47_9VIBR|nr:EAL domain-containing protein [Vibrio zhugei]